MPKSVKKIKNSNKNSNKIHITINNKSTSKRRRKGKPKAGSSSIQSHYGNAIPTIIQMHQPQPTLSQIADNRYGIGMSEKIDALAGGMTRVLENIENKQQEYYTKENSKAQLSNALTNREDELRVALQKQPPNATGHLELPKPIDNRIESPFPQNFLNKVLGKSQSLQSLPPPLNMNDAQEPTGLDNADSGFDGGLDDEHINFNHGSIYDNLDNKSIDGENPNVRPAPYPKGMTVAEYNRELKNQSRRQKYAEDPEIISKQQLKAEKKAMKKEGKEAKQQAKEAKKQEKEAEKEAKKKAKEAAKLAAQIAEKLEAPPKPKRQYNKTGNYSRKKLNTI